jgi:benzoyl-CoA reductase/2-hydroxyglutaryl-CoA dehydratase subunit BcrC/BadD/HgdB
MNVVGYSSPFVPAEWIAAHGLQPWRLRLRATENLTRGVCPYAAALIEDVIRMSRPAAKSDHSVPLLGTSSAGLTNCTPDCLRQAAAHRTGHGRPDPSPYRAVVLTTVCDQMRYAAATIEQRGGCPVFLLNVPSTWQTPASRQLYLDELRRLGRFLVRLGGHEPSDADLSQVMLAFDRTRRLTREGGRSDNANSRRPTAGEEPGAIPLAILGGPLMENDDTLFQLIEQAGGRVVLDATEGGERTLPRPFNAERLACDPLKELADAYFDEIPDAFRRPNTRLYEWLEREMTARAVRGIILRRYLWCDLWHAELARLKQWSPTPVLEIDVGPDDVSSPNRVQGRIEAFLETLK